MQENSSRQTAAPLHLHAIEKSYGQHHVLRSVSLSLEKGEIFGLIGLNGAGKTTLLKSVLGLIQTDKGSIEIFGAPSDASSSHDHLVYLPEKFYPSKYLKGWEYLKLCCSYYHQRLEKEHAAALSERLDLPAEKLSQQVRSYSKGMAQKLGLLGTLIIDVPLLILDEPMSGLDPRARIRLKEQLRHAKDSGKTLFFSSHILSDMDEICDRVGVLHEGELLFVGTSAEFKQRYPAATLEQSFLTAIEAPRDAA